MSKLRALTLVSLLIVAVTLGCSSSEETGEVFLAPAPTIVVPDNYTKFTDESESFSFHYPNHWDMEVSQLGDLEEWVKQAISSKAPDADTSGVNMFFFAGENTGDEFNPNVNVLIDRVPNDMTVEEYREGNIKLSRTSIDSWQLHSQQPVTLGGLRAYMKESSYALSELYPDAIGRFRSFQVSLKNPGAGIVWVITCGFTTPNPPSGASETCKTVVRSSQLLKKD
jgi:hypothetical protein